MMPPSRLDCPLSLETAHMGNPGEYGVEALRDKEPGSRAFFRHHFVDGVFLLGRGFVTLDSLPFKSQIEYAIEDGKTISPRAVWVWSREKELLMLWALINQINAYLLWGEADLTSYLGNIGMFIDDSS